MKNTLATAILAMGLAFSSGVQAQDSTTTAPGSTDVNVQVDAPAAPAAPAPASTTNIQVDAPSAPAVAPPSTVESKSTSVKETNNTVVQTPAATTDNGTNWALLIGLGVVGVIAIAALAGASNRATA